MKKKVLSLVLALSMVGASLAGCGSSNDTAAADTKTDAAAEETADAAATTEETKEITIAFRTRKLLTSIRQPRSSLTAQKSIQAEA